MMSRGVYTVVVAAAEAAEVVVVGVGGEGVVGVGVVGGEGVGGRGGGGGGGRGKTIRSGGPTKWCGTRDVRSQLRPNLHWLSYISNCSDYVVRIPIHVIVFNFAE